MRDLNSAYVCAFRTWRSCRPADRSPHWHGGGARRRPPRVSAEPCRMMTRHPLELSMAMAILQLGETGPLHHVAQRTILVLLVRVRAAPFAPRPQRCQSGGPRGMCVSGRCLRHPVGVRAMQPRLARRRRHRGGACMLQPRSRPRAKSRAGSYGARGARGGRGGGRCDHQVQVRRRAGAGMLRQCGEPKARHPCCGRAIASWLRSGCRVRMARPSRWT